jgi:hypothetical protein
MGIALSQLCECRQLRFRVFTLITSRDTVSSYKTNSSANNIYHVQTAVVGWFEYAIRTFDKLDGSTYEFSVVAVSPETIRAIGNKFEWFMWQLWTSSSYLYPHRSILTPVQKHLYSSLSLTHTCKFAQNWQADWGEWSRASACGPWISSSSSLGNMCGRCW